MTQAPSATRTSDGPAAPIATACSAAREVALEQRQDRLGLGVAEADVELEHPRAVGGQHQPGVQAAR